jgi:glycosyltransferase involved in cell wall biosynthesis
MGGVQRVAKFAKYLPESGWDVTVIAPQPGDYHNTDQSLLDELPQSIHIERVGSPSRKIPVGSMSPTLRWLSSWRNFPDRHRHFARLAVDRARELMRDRSFDVVLTSSPPPSVHFAGLALKRDIQWIADFRDPWQALVDDYGPSLFHRLKNSGLHQRILKSADAVLAVTPELRQHFESNCGANSVTVLRNGYDEADFPALESGTSSTSELRIVVPGTFSRFSDPRPILNAVAAFRRQFPDQSFKVTHVGETMGHDLKRLVANAGLEQIVSDTGYVNHAEAIRLMREADLLMLSYTDGRVTDVSVPGRIYEMLRSQRPIIALTNSPGALANLLAPIPGCEIVPADDPQKAAATIAKFTLLESRAPRLVSSIRQFERRAQAKDLAEVCRRAMDRWKKS